MNELVVGESRIVIVGLPARWEDQLASLRRAITARSQLVWGEHCTECSYPSCYASCAEYTPRADMHCRRFDRGIEAVKVDAIRDPLMRIRFRKWGKLEGEGPAPLLDGSAAARRDRARSIAALAVDLAPVPFETRRGLARLWTKAEARARSSRTTADSDFFVLECISPSERSVAFTISIVPNAARERGLFQQRIVLGPGYSRVVVPTAKIAAQVDLRRPFLVQIEPLEEAPPEELLFGLVDFVSSTAPLASIGQPIVPVASAAAKAKCVVWDLDNTVWNGTLAEDGLEGVTLDQRVVAVMRALDARGILQSVASKNDESEGLAALEALGIAEYLLHPQIGWGPKSQSLQRIAQLLDIGLDTLVLVDDQAFERSEVSETLGCVRVFRETEINALLEHPSLDVPVTAESRRRRQMVREEIKRAIAFETGGAGDYEAFLRSSEIRLTLSRLTSSEVTRIFELSQRTNQVNVSGTRYERHVVERMADGESETLPIVMHCADRFGDYGIIGFALLDARQGVVEDFFMSCRVQRKLVEHALFGHVARLVADAGGARLTVRYRRTDRNARALELFRDLGFALHETAPGIGVLERSLDPIPGADVVRLTGLPSTAHARRSHDDRTTAG